MKNSKLKIIKHRGGVLADKQFRIIGSTLHFLTLVSGFSNYYLNFNFYNVPTFLITFTYTYDCVICIFGYSTMPQWTSKEVYLHHLPLILGILYINNIGLIDVYEKSISTACVASVNEMGHSLISLSNNSYKVNYIKNIATLVWFSYFGIIASYEQHRANFYHILYIKNTQNTIIYGIHNYFTFFFVFLSILTQINLNLSDWPWWYKATIKNVFNIRMPIIPFYRVVHIFIFFMAFISFFYN
tara:strand:+ start:651 stop:1376 length:726 start_codon:yes stop_codon:yes gene_type:complete